jgi:hypothetical protein
MDVQLTNRLLALGYKDEPSVTRNMTNDCLFLCFVEFCKNTEGKCSKFTVTDEGQYLIWYPTHVNKPIVEREQLDISTATGMRLLAADACTYMLSDDTPNAQAQLLKRHILHRFRSAYMRQLDSEALNGEHLPDDASDADKFDHWKKLMRMNGASSMCKHSSSLQLLYTNGLEHDNTLQHVPSLQVGEILQQSWSSVKYWMWMYICTHPPTHDSLRATCQTGSERYCLKGLHM